MCGQSQATTRQTGKYMKLLTLLAMLSTPGSGTVFDETTIRVTVPIVLDDSLTTQAVRG